MDEGSDRALLRRSSRLTLSYLDKGATARDELPSGYRAIERTRLLGRGPSVFERACVGLMSWQMHRRSGFTVTAEAPTATVGTCVLLAFGVGSFRLTAPCRVVYVVSDERRRGFAYGTLPGHPERGEEAFVVTHELDDTVLFAIRAFSRPATNLARLGGPFSQRVQDLMTSRYLKSLHAIASS